MLQYPSPPCIFPVEVVKKVARDEGEPSQHERFQVTNGPVVDVPGKKQKIYKINKKNKMSNSKN